jgi:hypothetical protein
MDSLLEKGKKVQAQIYTFFDSVLLEKVRACSVDDCVRVDSSGAEGSTLITFIPSSSKDVITPIIFRNLLLLRLGMELEGVEDQLKCPCGKPVDRNGFHFLSNCSYGPLRIARHNAVASAIASMAQAAKLSTKLNSSESLTRLPSSVNSPLRPTSEPLGEKSSTDVTIYNWDSFHSLDIDVRITSPTSLSKRASAPAPGTQAAKIEQEKIDKYRSTVEANGGLFEPFGLELYGRWGEAARSNVFKPLVTKLEDNGWDRSIASHYWCCRITLASMVTGMRLLLNRAAGLAADKEFHIFSQQDEDDESILMPRSAPAFA